MQIEVIYSQKSNAQGLKKVAEHSPCDLHANINKVKCKNKKVKMMTRVPCVKQLKWSGARVIQHVETRSSYHAEQLFGQLEVGVGLVRAVQIVVVGLRYFLQRDAPTWRA